MPSEFAFAYTNEATVQVLCSRATLVLCALLAENLEYLQFINAAVAAVCVVSQGRLIKEKSGEYYIAMERVS